jgi:hypothetical protein
MADVAITPNQAFDKQKIVWNRAGLGGVGLDLAEM